ncbi:hypothetical protein V5O48_011057 [Marasmius crinis-equi]|uniref:Uncharacterized protein n=1 Tax=Marasmius crinis-equi TaxID=585013 RepID=A0ABR3F6N3_9AGAR
MTETGGHIARSVARKTNGWILTGVLNTKKDRNIERQFRLDGNFLNGFLARVPESTCRMTHGPRCPAFYSPPRPQPAIPIRNSADALATQVLYSFLRPDARPREVPAPLEEPEEHDPYTAKMHEIDWDEMDDEFQLQELDREIFSVSSMMEGIVKYLEDGPENIDSDEEDEEWDWVREKLGYSHVFSGKQLELFLWLLRVNGVDGVPSARSAKAYNEKLQRLYGIQTYKYCGAFGHIYYVNSLADIIAQEMSNPLVRPNLSFYPESTGNKLSEARQGARWLNELPDDELTPMIRTYRGSEAKDYYIFEPAQLLDGRICMPHRWFKREGRMRAKCWEMRDNGDSWTVLTNEHLEIDQSELIRSFPDLKHGLDWYGFSDVTKIRDIYEGETNTYRPWTLTDPSQGNRWRVRAKGRQCLAFPIWLYCDDTSGNTSKKWNEHNSFLFTAAGLNRSESSKEYNVHFLCTSNTAPPLEMLDGIVDQLCDAQEVGIWAFDCEGDQPVLMIPSVLAMLGDNPMQSEFACHIGLKGKYFCRCCYVKGKDAAEGREEVTQDGDGAEATEEVESTDECDGGTQAGSEGGSDVESDTGSQPGSPAPRSRQRKTSTTAKKSKTTTQAKKKRKQYQETYPALLKRGEAFIKTGAPRTAEKTKADLERHFQAAKTLGEASKLTNIRRESGCKDTYQMYFVDKLMDSYKNRVGEDARQSALDAAIEALPARTTSGIWRIKGLDPHADTPVEILHVVLLGFVKYLWRDVIKNQIKEKSDKKAVLSARLSSVWVEGLGLDALLSENIVNYYGSLTGGDFRKVAQVAPFILHDLVSPECYGTWVSLSKLIPLIWQPEILDLDRYLATLTNEIENFLLHAAKWSIQWFNKPKFHILLHLPEHIRRLGPSILFATESFESFNAVIREKSTHSNRQSPSRDIAYAFAQGSRLQHLLSGGKFLVKQSPKNEKFLDAFEDITLPQSERTTRVQSYFNKEDFDRSHWRSAGLNVLGLMAQSQDTICRYLGLSVSGCDQLKMRAKTCTFKKGLKPCVFAQTQTGRRFPDLEMFEPSAKQAEKFRPALEMVLDNGDKCSTDTSKVLSSDKTRFSDATPYVVARVPPPTNNSNSGDQRFLSIARVVEIVQFLGDQPEILATDASCVLVEILGVGSTATPHGMPRLYSTGAFQVLKPSDILCTVNVQHDCLSNKCQVKASRFRQQERHWTNIRKAVVEHEGKMDDVLLNTAQMRDAKDLQEFRTPPVLLPADETIKGSVNKEEKKRRTKQNVKNSTGQTMLAAALAGSSTSPATRTSGGTVPASGPGAPQNRHVGGTAAARNTTNSTPAPKGNLPSGHVDNSNARMPPEFGDHPLGQNSTHSNRQCNAPMSFDHPAPHPVISAPTQEQHSSWPPAGHSSSFASSSMAFHDPPTDSMPTSLHSRQYSRHHMANVSFSPHQHQLQSEAQSGSSHIPLRNNGVGAFAPAWMDMHRWESSTIGHSQPGMHEQTSYQTAGHWTQMHPAYYSHPALPLPPPPGHLPRHPQHPSRLRESFTGWEPRPPG